jgi:hypothetical protein
LKKVAPFTSHARTAIPYCLIETSPTELEAISQRLKQVPLGNNVKPHTERFSNSVFAAGARNFHKHPAN